MTALDLDAIEARADAATEGPWETWKQYDPMRGFRYGVEGPDATFVDGTDSRADAEFVARAREDVPALLAEVRRLSRRIADAERAIPIEYRDGTEFMYELDTASQALADVAAALFPKVDQS